MLSPEEKFKREYLAKRKEWFENSKERLSRNNTKDMRDQILEHINPIYENGIAVTSYSYPIEVIDMFIEVLGEDEYLKTKAIEIKEDLLCQEAT